MTKVTLYWSNICILHRLEKQMLDEAIKTLAAQGIDLEVRHFGIGYPQRMAEYLAQPEAALPDLIVSTDLEVFEDARIFDRFRGELYPLREAFPLREEIKNSPLCQWRELLPFLVIPLVFCAQGDYPVPPEGLTFAEILEESGVAFGGTDNSGAKAVVKTLWDLFGEQAACNFARQSAIHPMPINAFQKVKTGGARLAIVPSVYAKSANGVSMKRHWPGEGAIGLPSYVAARRSIPLDVAHRVLKVLLSEENCVTYERDGDLYCALEWGSGVNWAAEQGAKLLYPSPQWFADVAPAHFEQVYSGLARQPAR